MNPYDQIRRFERGVSVAAQGAASVKPNRVQIWRCDEIPCDPGTVIHKRRQRAVYFDAWTACDLHVEANEAVWLWAKVKCPDCLKKRPRAKGRVSRTAVRA